MTSAILAVTLSLTGVAASGIPGGSTAPDLRVPNNGPFIEVWTSGEVFQRGERVHVWFRSAEDAFVTVLRVDTDGRIRVLYPQQPWYNNYVPAGHRFEVSNVAHGRQPYAFEVDDYPGTGYVFAISSRVPFEYRPFIDGDRWDYRNIAYYGRVTGDPYVALMDLIDHMLPPNGYDGYSYDVYPYHVDRRYDYPRFLCYDCHTYVAYPAWNPYRHSCVKFRLVVYDDPYYYPARVYAGTRVVYVRPRRVEARFVFQSRGDEASFITRVPRRPVNTTSRRVPEREATAGAQARVGVVPAPVRQPSGVATSPRRRVTLDPNPGEQTRVTGESQTGGNPAAVPGRPRLQRREPQLVPERRPESQTPVRRLVPDRTQPAATQSIRPRTDQSAGPTVVKPVEQPPAKAQPAKPAVRQAPAKKKVKPDSTVRRRPGG